MAEEKKIKNALISVFDKTGLDVIVKKLNDVRDGVEVHDLEEKEIGSFVMQVDFLNNDESIPNKYYKTTLKTSGFSYNEIAKLVQHIFDNMD